MSQQSTEQQIPQLPTQASPDGSGFAPSSLWVAISFGMGVMGFLLRGAGKGRGLAKILLKLNDIWGRVEELPELEQKRAESETRLEQTILSGQKSTQEQFSDMMRLFLDMQKGLNELKDKLETYQDEIEALQESFDEKHTELKNKLGEVKQKTGELTLTIEKLKPFYNIVIDTLLRSFPHFIDRDDDMKALAFASGRSEKDIREKQQKFIRLKKEGRRRVESIDQNLPPILPEVDESSAH